MSLGEETQRLLSGLVRANIHFVVVGGSAALMQAVPLVTFDLDIVHQRSPENVDRLLTWLLDQHAFHRFDLARRMLPPTREQLLGHGHLNLQLDMGKLDVLCELGPGEGYDEIVPHSVLLEREGEQVWVLGLEKLIEVKARAGRPKDRAVLPLILATLDEQRRARDPASELDPLLSARVCARGAI